MMCRQDRVDTRIAQALSDLTEGHTHSSRTRPYRMLSINRSIRNK
jgi:hypothetical protein